VVLKVGRWKSEDGSLKMEDGRKIKKPGTINFVSGFFSFGTYILLFPYHR